MIDKIEIARKFMEAIPHAKAMGMELTELTAGRAEITMPFSNHLVGDPNSGVIAGGAVFAMLDTCCGAAVVAHPGNPGATATIDLRIDYMRAATPGQSLRARAECYHLTRSVAFVRATTYDADPDNPVATATGTFTVEAKT